LSAFVDPVTFTVVAAPDAQSPSFALAYVPQPDRVASLSWDAGDASLPGSL
jgi:hypothetical protein